MRSRGEHLGMQTTENSYMRGFGLGIGLSVLKGTRLAIGAFNVLNPKPSLSGARDLDLLETPGLSPVEEGPTGNPEHFTCFSHFYQDVSVVRHSSHVEVSVLDSDSSTVAVHNVQKRGTDV